MIPISKLYSNFYTDAGPDPDPATQRRQIRIRHLCDKKFFSFFSQIPDRDPTRSNLFCLQDPNLKLF
jgi:hypothetical protein